MKNSMMNKNKSIEMKEVKRINIAFNGKNNKKKGMGSCRGVSPPHAPSTLQNPYAGQTKIYYDKEDKECGEDGAAPGQEEKAYLKMVVSRMIKKILPNPTPNLQISGHSPSFHRKCTPLKRTINRPINH